MAKVAFGAVVSAAATGILVACAVAIVALLAHRELSPRALAAGPAPLQPQPDWQSYATGGHRLGPSGARAVIVEFADFQCPACRALEPRLRAERTEHPQDVAVIYRHYPLVKHIFARPAAIASECAARQGRFEAMHDTLFVLGDSIGVRAWHAVARAAAVPDLRAFDVCMSDGSANDVLLRDSVAARRLRVIGTPTLLIDGVRVNGGLPQATLDSLVTKALQHGTRRSED